MILVITNPVNSTVPIASEVFKKAGCYDPTRSAFTVLCSDTILGAYTFCYMYFAPTVQYFAIFLILSQLLKINSVPQSTLMPLATNSCSLLVSRVNFASSGFLVWQRWTLFAPTPSLLKRKVLMLVKSMFPSSEGMPVSPSFHYSHRYIHCTCRLFLYNTWYAQSWFPSHQLYTLHAESL